jgi:short-subunit dehydrogenase
MTSSRSELALVTGASAGIGRALAERLAKRGDGVILVARNRAKLEDFARYLFEEYGVMTYPIACDLADPGGARALVEALIALDLKPTVLINCAAVGATGAFWEASTSTLSRMLNLNTLAMVQLTRHVLPHMTAINRGTILNVSSMVSAFPVPFMACYGATKAFVTSFTQALRLELHGTGVIACELSPGVVLTDFQETAGYTLTDAERNSAMTADQVAASALDAVARNRAVHVPGFLNAVAATVLALVPKWFVAWCTARFMQKTGRARLSLAPPVARAQGGGVR